MLKNSTKELIRLTEEKKSFDLVFGPNYLNVVPNEVFWIREQSISYTWWGKNSFSNLRINERAYANKKTEKVVQTKTKVLSDYYKMYLEQKHVIDGFRVLVIDVKDRSFAEYL